MQLNLLKIDNCSEQDTQDLEEYIRQLYTYIKKKLQFKINPTIRLVGDAENSQNPLGQTGNYEPGTNTITVFITDRHTKDILRSICHELAHHNQNCNERISGHGGMENGYAQNDEHLRALEKEAYEASILLRDWEDEMKNDNGNEPLFESFFESLDDYREKRQSLITEAVYKKFGFSTKFIKEASRKKVTAQVQTKRDPETDALLALNRRAIEEIIVPLRQKLPLILREFDASLTKEERLSRATGYGSNRIKNLLDELPEKFDPDANYDVTSAALSTLYHGVGRWLDHFNTQPNDPLTSSDGRQQDKILQRKQPWGPVMLGHWADLEIPVVFTIIDTAFKLISLNFKEYSKIPVVYRPAAARENAFPTQTTSFRGFKLAYDKIVKAINSRKEAATAQQPAPASSVSGADFDGDDEPLEETQRRKLSETRKNTLNTLRLLESLTKKGRR